MILRRTEVLVVVIISAPVTQIDLLLFYPESGIAATLVQRKWGNILFKNSQELLQFLVTQECICSVNIV